MPITTTPSGGTIVTGSALADVRLITLKHALRLELAGLTRRGSSAYAILKREYGYRGDKRTVLAALTADIEAALRGTPAAEKDHTGA